MTSVFSYVMNVKGKGNVFLHGDLICTYTIRIYIWHLCRRFMHYKRKT